MCFAALKGIIFNVLFSFAAAGVLLCSGHKMFHQTSSTLQLIVNIKSLEDSRNLKVLV